jgi:hypothetical protein
MNSSGGGLRTGAGHPAARLHQESSGPASWGRDRGEFWVCGLGHSGVRGLDRDGLSRYLV